MNNAAANMGVHISFQDPAFRDFPGGPVDKSLRSHCRGLGSSPGRGTRSHMPKLSPHIATTSDFACSRAQAPQIEKPEPQ